MFYDMRQKDQHEFIVAKAARRLLLKLTPGGEKANSRVVEVRIIKCMSWGQDDN